MSETITLPGGVSITPFSVPEHNGVLRRGFNVKGPDSTADMTVIGTTDLHKRQTRVDTFFQFGGEESNEAHACSIVPLGFEPEFCTSCRSSRQGWKSLAVSDKDVDAHIDFFAKCVLEKMELLPTMYSYYKEDAHSVSAKRATLLQDKNFERELKKLFDCSQKYDDEFPSAAPAAARAIFKHQGFGDPYALLLQHAKNSMVGRWVRQSQQPGWDESTVQFPEDSASLLSVVAKHCKESTQNPLPPPPSS